MPIFPIFRWPYFAKRRAVQPPSQAMHPAQNEPQAQSQLAKNTPLNVRRFFFNLPNCQCYASFFHHWQGWITAGHVLSDTGHIWPDFISAGDNITTKLIWPGGLDAALAGCVLPPRPPVKPKIGQRIIVYGYPAGSDKIARRRGAVYLERGAGSGTWIAHITQPDEPVVTGMSGGPVVDADSGNPVGILITRNSPADLNADRDPDESCDFISLRALWHTIKSQSLKS